MKKFCVFGLLVSFVVLLLAVGNAFAQAVPPAPQGDLVLNQSFETADPNNSNLAANWAVYGQPYTRVHNFNVWDQNFVVQLQANQGAVQHIVLNQTYPYRVRLTARVKGDSIVDDPNDVLGASLDCKVYFQNGETAWCYTTKKTKNVGTFDWTEIGFNTASLNVSTLWAKIAWIDVRIRMGNVGGTAWFDSVTAEEYTPSNDTGMVTFCFHDSFLSTYTKGYPLLKSYGMVGSEAAVTSYLGLGAHMSLFQLQDLYANGWTILSHTVHHPDMTTLSLLDLNDEFYWSQKFLADNGIPTRHFAYPFGNYNGLTMQRLEAQRYGNLKYDSAQVDGDYNMQGMFPYNVGVFSIKYDTTVQQIKDWVNLQKAFHGWAVFVIHEIDNANGPWTVTYDMLHQMVQAVADSGAKVVSYDEGFDRITNTQ